MTKILARNIALPRHPQATERHSQGYWVRAMPPDDALKIVSRGTDIDGTSWLALA
jgi:hypothetical protein